MDERTNARLEVQEALLLFLLRRFPNFEIRAHGVKTELSPAGRVEFDRIAAIAGRQDPK